MILVRELDERLGLETFIAEHLSDSRQGLNTQFRLADLLRQSIYSRLAGYEDLSDAVRLSADPTFRLIGSPKIWDRGAALTSTPHWFEVIRMPANESLAGRPSHKPLVRYKSFRYQAGSWTQPRRIVAKVEHHAGELFPRVGFIVTNLRLPSRAVVRVLQPARHRRTVDQGRQAGGHWTRLSCHRFRANEVRLQLSVLAYNLGNLWRRLVLPQRIDNWSLTSVQQRLVKTGGRLIPRAVLLAVAGGESSDPTAVRGDVAADLGPVGPDRLTGGEFSEEEGGRRKGTSMERCLRNTQEPGAPVGSTSTRTELTVSGAGSMWHRKALAALGGPQCITAPIRAAKMEIPAKSC